METNNDIGKHIMIQEETLALVLQANENTLKQIYLNKKGTPNVSRYEIMGEIHRVLNTLKPTAQEQSDANFGTILLQLAAVTLYGLGSTMQTIFDKIDSKPLDDTVDIKPSETI